MWCVCVFFYGSKPVHNDEYYSVENEKNCQISQIINFSDDIFSFFRFETQEMESSQNEKALLIKPKLLSLLKLLIHMSFALCPMLVQVKWLVPVAIITIIIISGSWFEFFWLFFLTFAGIRGQEHEISIVTKKGVEARTYDGVSILERVCLFLFIQL